MKKILLLCMMSLSVLGSDLFRCEGQAKVVLNLDSNLTRLLFSMKSVQGVPWSTYGQGHNYFCQKFVQEMNGIVRDNNFTLNDLKGSKIMCEVNEFEWFSSSIATYYVTKIKIKNNIFRLNTHLERHFGSDNDTQKMCESLSYLFKI